MRIGQPIWQPIYEVVLAAETSHSPVSTPQSLLPNPLSPSIQQTPDLDAWLRIDINKTITILTGKVEIGQGIKTALAQIAAEELDVSLERIVVISGDTAQTPDEGITAGSMSLQMSGNALRLAAAEARQILLALAFEELEAETNVSDLQVNDGTITDPVSGRQVTYWQLMGGQRFGRQITGIAQPKSPDAYQLVGEPVKRQDLRAKVTGQASYVHDLRLPGMVHGRVVRPPAYQMRLLAVAETAVRQMPGVIEVVHDGRFLAVIAEREEQAIWASELLRESATWENRTVLPLLETLYDHLLSQPAESVLVVKGTAVSDSIPPLAIPAKAAQTVQATYYRPYQMHASLSPSAAVAHLVDGKLTVWSHTQGVFLLQGALAQVLGMETADIHVIHSEGSGCYGHNGAEDAALDAALLARAVPGRPVSLKWMRSDEHGWEPYGSAMVVKLQASLDSSGRVIDWNHDVWSYPHSSRPRPAGEGQSGLLAAWHLERPFSPPPPRNLMGTHFGGYRNADPLYEFPQRRVVSHFVPNSPLRTSSLRSLGAYANVFAIESFMDELAYAADVDPVAFRLRHLTDERARAVIQAAADKAGWREGGRSSKDGRGQGLAFAQYKNSQCYAAVVVEVRVEPESGQIHLERAVIAADAGQVVNPDGLSNQLEGGFVQAASWTLAEQVSFDQRGILSQDWESYPILRFSGVPRLETVLLNRPKLPFLGSGEATQNPTPAAIANAVFAASGIRLRQIPFTPERVRAASLTRKSSGGFI
jgi:CO/xanthine dehydrogenase Mo-binding subunit